MSHAYSITLSGGHGPVVASLGVCDVLSASWWTGVNAIVLFLTLLLLVWYAGSTHKIMLLQREELGLRKLPVVTIINRDPFEVMFRTTIRNTSNVHAKAWITASVHWGGRELTFRDTSPYSGKFELEIQALGALNGHLDLPNVLRQNGIDPEIMPEGRTTVQFAVRVRNHAEEVHEKDEVSTNPPVRYYWLRVDEDAAPTPFNPIPILGETSNDATTAAHPLMFATADPRGGQLYAAQQTRLRAPRGRWVPYFSELEIQDT